MMIDFPRETVVVCPCGQNLHFVCPPDTNVEAFLLGSNWASLGRHWFCPTCTSRLVAYACGGTIEPYKEKV